MKHVKNGTQESTDNKTVWINGGIIADTSGTYYPTLKFKLKADTIQQIELTNQNMNPGPYHKKPLSYADAKIGGIQIGDSNANIQSLHGVPPVIREPEETTLLGIDLSTLIEKLEKGEL